MRYQYEGPPSRLSLGKDKHVRVTLVPGQQYDLPERNSHVKVLVSRRYLVPVPPPAKEAKTQATPPAPHAATEPTRESKKKDTN